MFIYLTHYQLIRLVEKAFGEQHPWPTLFMSLLFGVAAAHVYSWLDRRVMQSRLMTRTMRREPSLG